MCNTERFFWSGNQVGKRSFTQSIICVYVCLKMFVRTSEFLFYLKGWQWYGYHDYIIKKYYFVCI